MPYSERFGPILSAEQIEDSVLATLVEWTPYYIAEMERQTGRTPEELPFIRSFSTQSQFDALPGDDRLPLAVVISPGLSETPVKDGSGRLRARWIVGVAVVTSARDHTLTRRLAGLYGAVVRSVLLQHQTLDGNLDGIQGVEWVDERYDDLDFDVTRSLAAAREMFEVEVRDVVNVKTGPLTAPEDPYELPSDWPTVEENTNEVTTIGG